MSLTAIIKCAYAMYNHFPISIEIYPEAIVGTSVHKEGRPVFPEYGLTGSWTR